jgi:hypothetical protein
MRATSSLTVVAGTEELTARRRLLRAGFHRGAEGLDAMRQLAFPCTSRGLAAGAMPGVRVRGGSLSVIGFPRPVSPWARRCG